MEAKRTDQANGALWACLCVCWELFLACTVSIDHQCDLNTPLDFIHSDKPIPAVQLLDYQSYNALSFSLARSTIVLMELYH